MIPAITPPTDNLYKFIALFGLTIFLFSVYNMSLVYDNYSLDKAKVEELKTSIRKKSIQFSNDQKYSKGSSAQKKERERLLFKQLTSELEETERVLDKTKLSEGDFIQFKGEIRKLNVAIEALRFKLGAYIFLGLVGIFLMFKGFISWQKKEQDIRDSILHIEHAIKLLEQENRARKKKKKKKQAVPVAAVPVEKQHVAEHIDQN